MTRQSKAKIFLSAERGVDESGLFRSYHTFNFGSYLNEYKIPFGGLYTLNDDSFAGGHAEKMTIGDHSYVILLPVVGSIGYKDSQGHENTLNAGELQVIDMPAGSGFEVRNPYENELVNVLQFRILSNEAAPASIHKLLAFDLEEKKNNLIELIEIAGNPQYLKLSIGQFRGREESLYHMNCRKHGLFVFVIEGAFEVQGRLLHPRDGLALWELDEPVDMEALSNEAIIVLVETGM